MGVTTQDVLRWVEASQKVFAEQQQRLTEMDQAVGDGDFGFSVARGFAALQTELSAKSPADIKTLCSNAASILIKTMGGSSGPLFGTFFLRAGATCAGKSELGAADVAAFFQAGVEGMQQRGKAEVGDKTMMDALIPAAQAMRSAADGGASLTEVLDRGAAAAEAGAQATIGMQARKGRGSYLGERSVGHPDPGAVAAHMLIKAAADSWRS